MREAWPQPVAPGKRRAGDGLRASGLRLGAGGLGFRDAYGVRELRVLIMVALRIRLSLCSRVLMPGFPDEKMGRGWITIVPKQQHE